MTKIRIGSGSSYVYLEDGQAAAFERVLREIAPQVTAELEMAAQRVATDAAEEWPVSPDSGPPRKTKAGTPDKRSLRRGAAKNKVHSKDLFEVGIEVNGNTIGVYVTNTADYAYYIKSYQGKLYGRSPWVELVRKPGVKLKKELAVKLQDELIKLAKGK